MTDYTVRLIDSTTHHFPDSEPDVTGEGDAQLLWMLDASDPSKVQGMFLMSMVTSVIADLADLPDPTAAPASFSTTDVNRLTVVDQDGRAYERVGVTLRPDFQDNGRTLKIFTYDLPDGERAAILEEMAKGWGKTP